MNDDLFTETWLNSISPQEVAETLHLSVRSANTHAKKLALPPHPQGSALRALKAQDFTTWEDFASVEEFAQAHNIATVMQNLRKLNEAAEFLQYEKKPMRITPRTPEGDTAQVIIGAWIDWWRQDFSVPPTNSTIAAVGREVRQLIQAGYNSAEIKIGMWRWSVLSMSSKYPPAPARITNYTYQWRAQQSSEARQAIAAHQEASDLVDNQLGYNEISTPRVEGREW